MFLYFLHCALLVDRGDLYTEILLCARVLSYFIRHVSLYLLEEDTFREWFFHDHVVLLKWKKKSLSCVFLSLRDSWNYVIYTPKKTYNLFGSSDYGLLHTYLRCLSVFSNESRSPVITIRLRTKPLFSYNDTLLLLFLASFVFRAYLDTLNFRYDR